MMEEAVHNITRDAFVSAVHRGDVAVIASYFAQPHVQAEVAEIEALLAGSNGVILPRSLGDSSVYPWYYLYQPRVAWRERVLVFEVAVIHHHTDVLRWFFSPPRMAQIRGTLARVLAAVAGTAVRVTNGEILDWLLSADVSGALQSELSYQKLLYRLLQWTKGRVDMLKILLAHGANVNETGVLPTWAGFASQINGEIAAQAGAFYVGAELLYYPIAVKNTAVARQLLKYGVQAKDSRTSLLHEAMNRKSINCTQLLIEEGFADVDERFVNDHPPLMAACDLISSSNAKGDTADETPLILTQMLLKSGADVTLRDPKGQSALQHAVAREGHADVVRLLKEHGAE